MEKAIVNWFIANGYVGIGIVVAIFFITIAVVLRVNKVLDTFKKDDEERKMIKKEIAILDKRTSKIMAVMGLCKSVTTPNKLWVQNDKRNGGDPPDNHSLCELENNYEYEDEK